MENTSIYNAKINYSLRRTHVILEWMSHKWALVTLLKIEEMCADGQLATVRFGDLFRSIPQISEKMLASTLDYLVQEGLLIRRPYPLVPPRVDYGLTPVAQSFLREISYVIEWGQQHFEEIAASRSYGHVTLTKQ